MEHLDRTCRTLKEGCLPGTLKMGFVSAFAANHPILMLLYHSTSIRWTIQMTCVVMEFYITISAEALFFVPEANPADCQQPNAEDVWANLWFKIAVALICRYLSLVPCIIIVSIHKMGQMPTSDDPAVMKRRQARQHCKDVFLVLAGLSVSAVFITSLLSFLAGVSKVDQMKWLLCASFAMLEVWFIEPLVFSIIWQGTVAIMTKDRRATAKARLLVLWDE